jgi:hypothetical protein
MFWQATKVAPPDWSPETQRVVACTVLAVALSLYVIEAQQIHGRTQIAVAMLVVALVLEAIDRRENQSVKAAAISA